MKSVLKNKKRELLLLGVIVLVSLIFAAMNPAFLRWSNLSRVLSNNSVYGIMALGMMLVIATGNIDVSVGAQLAVISMVVGSLVQTGAVTNPAVIILVSLLLGLVLGVVNGFLVAKLKLAAIIVTLGTLNIMRGLLLIILGSSWISGLPDWFTAIARTQPLAGLKVMALAWIGMCIVTWFIMFRTMAGRKVLAVGANPEGAARVGFKPSSTYIFTFAFMGITSGLGSLFYTSNIGMTQPVAGIGYEMTLIAAVVIGGTSFSGGKISILGTFLGVLLLGIIENGMVMVKVPVYWQELVTGAVITTAIIFSSMDYLKKRNKAKNLKEEA